ILSTSSSCLLTNSPTSDSSPLSLHDALPICAYRPLIFHWLRRYDLQASDAEDIAQEVMSVVVRRVGEFDHNGRVGAFRHWLRTVTVHTARNFLGRHAHRPEATGSSAFLEMLGQLEQPDSDISRPFDRQHD